MATKKEDTENVSIETAKTGTLAVAADPELAKLYADNAKVGAQNLANELPLLKIHTTNKSLNNLLADGSDPTDGWFFYRPTKEQFQTVTCHILTISRGYKAESLPDKNGKTREVFNQILAGVIVDGSEFKPFMIYFTGLKLDHLWKFGKEASAYTKAKPVPIPMFALTVKLTTSKAKHDFGTSWIIDFEIVKDEKGVPQVVTDAGIFVFLRDHVATVEDTIASLIANKSTEETTPDDVPHPAETVEPITKARRLETTEPEDLPAEGSEDIPF